MALREVWLWLCFSGEVTCKDHRETVRDAKDAPAVSIARTCDLQSEDLSIISHLITIPRETRARVASWDVPHLWPQTPEKVRTGYVWATTSGGYVLDIHRNQSFLYDLFQMSSHAVTQHPGVPFSAVFSSSAFLILTILYVSVIYLNVDTKGRIFCLSGLLLNSQCIYCTEECELGICKLHRQEQSTLESCRCSFLEGESGHAYQGV